MSSLAEAEIIGNLGRDPEMRYTPNGKAVTNFSVAVNSNRKDDDTVKWFEVQCWDKLAETANAYLAKGRQVFIRGDLELRTWQDKRTGETRAAIRITAQTLRFLGSKQDKPDAASGDWSDEDTF